jgi:iron complex outermembrane recepter protein
VMTGIDWRTFVGKHWREVRNLLGGDFYRSTSNANAGTEYLGLGGRYDYNFDNQVDWLGGFLQGEYAFSDRLTGYGTFAASVVSYEHTNYFLAGSPTLKADDLDPSLTLKGGANYLLSDEINLYANAGWLSKTPIFDNVIDDGSFMRYEDPENETILALEGGLGYSSLDRSMAANVNLYYTNWMDRSWSSRYTSLAGVEYLYNIPGVDALHTGLEIDALWRPDSRFQLKATASIGSWEWQGDATSIFRPDDNPNESEEIALALDGLMVSDAPQTQFSLSPTWHPLPGAYLGLDIKYAADYYADFDPTSRAYDPTDPALRPDAAQSWKVPSRTLLDLHAGYTLRFNDLSVEVFGHVFNLADARYINEADDGSGHDAATARVQFGMPRTWTLGMAIDL